MSNPPTFDVRQVNAYAAHKQHLQPASTAESVVQVVRDLVALHSTTASTPYLSLWARTTDFTRPQFEAEVYERRTLARVLCMRSTLHVVPSEEFARFLRAYATPHEAANQRLLRSLVAESGLCPPEEIDTFIADLERQVLAVIGPGEARTVEEISGLVPPLRTKVLYGVGRAYVGEFALGARLVPGMCVRGLLVRARPRGTWRGNLWRYARLGDWLPAVDLDGVSEQEARTWLVRRYIRAFGPVTIADAQWWTGLAKGEITRAVDIIGAEVVPVAPEGMGEGHLMLAEDLDALAAFAPPAEPNVFLLPALDPYIMGYQDRRRFLDPAHRTTVFDYAGNARPSVWAGGRVVGTWREEKRGAPGYALFESITLAEQALLNAQFERLAAFLVAA